MTLITLQPSNCRLSLPRASFILKNILNNEDRVRFTLQYLRNYRGPEPIQSSDRLQIQIIVQLVLLIVYFS